MHCIVTEKYHAISIDDGHRLYETAVEMDADVWMRDLPY